MKLHKVSACKENSVVTHTLTALNINEVIKVSVWCIGKSTVTDNVHFAISYTKVSFKDSQMSKLHVEKQCGSPAGS